jgi:hypothetical protein
MKRAAESKMGAKIALALTWDGARWPVKKLPAKARAFLAMKGSGTPSPREMARLFVEEQVSEMRICWVPRLKGGDDVLAEVFPAPQGRRVSFRATRVTRLGDVLGVVYRRVSK